MSDAPKIVFAGSPAFALPTLKLLSKGNLRPCLVITMPDSKKGRGKKLLPTPVKLLAQQLRIQVITTDNINNLLPMLQELKPDIIVTVAYGGYLRANIRKLPRYGCINLHPSLLPAYRGANPIKYPLLRGEKLTGYTIFKIVAKMDAGAIYYQQEIKIEDTDNFASLQEKLARDGAKGVLHTVQKILSGAASTKEQDHALATYTHKTKKEDTYLNWHSTAQQISNFVRAYSPKPGAITALGKQSIKIIACQITSQRSSSTPGTVEQIHKNEGFSVSTQDVNILVTSVQPAGKKLMDAYAFTLGKADLLGTKLSSPL